MIKVSELLHHELSFLIQKRFPKHFITVQNVVCAPDLHSARVWVSIFGQKDKKEIEKIIELLQKSAHFFQKDMGKKLDLRYIPKLEFLYDETPAKAQKIEELLDKNK
jgi:ribosome-binding factor A